MAKDIEITDETVYKNLGGIFSNSFTSSSSNNRSSHLEDEFVIRRAKIVEVLGPQDDRIRVQILGENTGISDEEKDNLPCFPPFFTGTSLPGDVDDLVWVVCTPDCKQGYIIGKPSIFTENLKYIKSTAYGFDKIKQYLQQRQALPSKGFEYENIIIDKCVMTEDGGIVEGYDRKTGNWFLLNSSGAVITVQQEKIYLRVGSPSTSGSGSGFSALEMTTDMTTFKCPNFVIDADTVSLGHNGLNAAGLVGSMPCVGKNCVPVIPVSTIKL